MPIPLPNLDDLTFEQLTTQARDLIPGLQPEWTNHNESDPGIVLVELLAWLTEMLLYRVNQIPKANVEKFLGLLNGPGWSAAAHGDLESATRDTMLRLRRRFRAVTVEDYEALIVQADERVRRVRCIPRRNLAADDSEQGRAIAPAHVSVVVLLEPPVRPDDDILARLRDFLDERRILTTRHHIVEPGYVPVEIAANLAVRPDALSEDALRAAHLALVAFLDPMVGGPGRSGWPFGRALHAADVYALLDQVASIDWVEDVRVNGNDEVELDEHELVLLTSTTLTAYDVHGGRQVRRSKP